MISVKADTAALRRDVQQLLSNRRKHRRPSIESSCESVITLAAERLVKADSSTSRKPSSAEDSDSEISVSSNKTNEYSGDNDSIIAELDTAIKLGSPKKKPKDKEMTCCRLRRLKWYTDSHKTQCVTITPEGDIVAMSSMKEVTAWDMDDPDHDPMRLPLRFDDGLRSWHVPTKLVLEHVETSGLILAASSSHSLSGGWGGKSVESKLLVHSYSTDKTLCSRVLSRRLIDMALSFSDDGAPTIKVILPSLKRTCSISLVRQGDKMATAESEVKLDTGGLELDEYSSGLSLCGEYLLAAAKNVDRYSALVVFLFSTSTGETVGRIKLPDGFRLVTGIPIGSRGRKVVLILWRDDRKETGFFHWDATRKMELDSEVVVQHFAYAGAAWQRYAVSPDGQFIAVCLSKHAVGIVSARTGERVTLLRLKDSLPPDMGTSKSGLELTKGNCRGRLMAWSVTKRQLVIATRRGAEVWDIRGAL